MKSLYLYACASALAAWMAFQGPSPARADEPATAAENYQTFCLKCHGEHGKGDGPGAAMLNPKPRDFADCANMEKHSDAEMFKVISQGGEAVGMSPDMQPWGGTLSDPEIHALVKFVRSFCKKPAAPAAEHK